MLDEDQDIPQGEVGLALSAGEHVVGGGLQVMTGLRHMAGLSCRGGREGHELSVTVTSPPLTNISPSPWRNPAPQHSTLFIL